MVFYLLLGDFGQPAFFIYCVNWVFFFLGTSGDYWEWDLFSFLVMLEKCSARIV